MPRTMWKGAISFGLVSIPVRLYPATEEKTLRFNQLHDEDHGRIKYQRVCAVDGEEVTFEHIVKGYEYEKDKYVVLTDEFNPSQFKDEYREAMLQIVEKKIAGEEIEVIAEPEATKVVDLMQALKQSVEATKKKAAPKKAASRQKKAAAS